MHSQRNFVLNIGFGRSPTSIFEVGFEKSDSKNCELASTCPACYDCKCKNFLNRKITVRFKLNLKTDGLNCKMIFKSGERIERLHSCSKQCRRIYICLFCVAKYLLGTPKPVNCIRWMQAAFPDSTRFFALREWTIPPGVPVHRLPAQEQSDPTGHCILPDNAVGTNWSHTPRS